MVFHVDFCCFLVCFTVRGVGGKYSALPLLNELTAESCIVVGFVVGFLDFPHQELTLLQRKVGKVSFIAFHMSLEVIVLVL